ncbi:MAG: TolC family protein [Bacteroidia bacterium]
MTLDDYYRIVMAHHPVAKQAATFSDAARAELRIAKGFLDPKATVDYEGKTLAGTEYYDMWDNTLKVPVWIGTDVKVGFERNTGTNVNPEQSTNASGLWYAGISVPLGQGLFIDERRNAIRQAQLLPQMAEADRVKTVNKLLLQVTKDYWEWYFQTQRVKMLQQGYQLALQRFEAVKARALQGDLPAIDTVEALIAVQDRDNQYQQAKADYLNAMMNASSHLWKSDGTPLELTEQIIPVAVGAEVKSMPADSMNALVNTAMINHPDLLKYGYKQRQLFIEEKYQRDKFKPKLNVQYNFITKSPENVSPEYFNNSYKLGLNFSYNLFLRQERGKVQLVEVKQQQLAFERQQREREITIGIQSVYNNWIALESQLITQEKQVRNAQMLRDGEQQRFNAGESSFFLVNTRENSLISAQIKYYELQAKYAKNKAELYWSAGRLIAN